MSPTTQSDQELQKLIQDLMLRIVLSRSGEFDRVWEAANRVCDRYELTKAV